MKNPLLSSLSRIRTTATTLLARRSGLPARSHERERAGTGDHEGLPRCPLCADAIEGVGGRRYNEHHAVIITADPCGHQFYVRPFEPLWKSFTIQQAVNPPSCPVCGSKPAWQERIHDARYGSFVETLPGSLHCPNEDRPDHLESRGLLDSIWA